MNARALDQLLRVGAIERRTVSARVLSRLITRARQDEVAARELERIGDLERAYTVLYEAALRLCIAIVGKRGYRVPARPGHHRAALQAAAALLGRSHDATLSRVDDARQFRNASLYGDARPTSREELSRATSDLRSLLRAAEARGPRAKAPRPAPSPRSPRARR